MKRLILLAIAVSLFLSAWGLAQEVPAASRPVAKDVTYPIVPGNAGLTTQHLEKTGLIPLCDMTAKDTYKGEDGGLYGRGQNDPPTEQLKATKMALAKITPLDENGQPSPTGRIVLMSQGMSNTMNEFSRFQHEFADKGKSPAVVVVNGAQGGQTVSEWAKPESPVWEKAEKERLKNAGVTPKQVQVVWLKQAIGGPFRFGEFPRHAQAMEELLIQNINQLLLHYLNLKIIYLSSRIYGGNATINLQPEPYAYEEGFSVRWVIQDQIKGEPRLNFDPAKGPVKAPVLLWGPYLWADGSNPCKSDGLSYDPQDFAADGIHPAESAQKKIARLLQAFFTNELNTPWYVKGNAATSQAK